MRISSRTGGGRLVLVLAVASTVATGIRTPKPARADADMGQALRELDSSGITGGLLVHVGCGEGKKTASLPGFVVHGLDSRAENVLKARNALQALGCYGRISVDRFDGIQLPYADNLANAILVEDSADVSVDELLRVLCPRGLALVEEGQRWRVVRKPWPEEIDEWTHWLHDASGNAVANDRRVGPPQHVQWIERPLWQRHHDMMATIPAMVSAGGKVFYLCDEAPATAKGMPDRWRVVARDGFNGIRLWSHPMGKWGWKYWHTSETAQGRWGLPFHVTRRLVADGRRVYVTLDFNGPLTALDATTGDVVRNYAGTESTDEILLQDGVLLLSVSKSPQHPGRIGKSQAAGKPDTTPQGPAARKEVVAIEADSGKVLWRRGDYLGIATREDILERFTYLSLAANSRQVFLIEEDAVVSLELKTGREMWRWPRPPRTAHRGLRPYRPGNMCTLVATDNVLVYAQPEEGYEKSVWNRGVNSCFLGISAETGKTLWSRQCGYWTTYGPPDIFVIDGLAWTHAAEGFDLIGVDLSTGDIAKRYSTQSVFDEVHHHRCYRNKATERYLLTARRGIEFLDVATGQCQAHHWVRGGCRYGIMPCNGLVYAPPHPCQCYITDKISGFFALAAAPARHPVVPPPAEADPMEQGPAWGQLGPAVEEPDPETAWPTYRGNIRRSGTTDTPGPNSLEHRWQTKVGGRPSACTIALGRVFFAVVDQHRVVALKADTGEPAWSFTAGGRVDTPPTIYRGLALFGSADGWVYALRATDGQLVWRRRIAPLKQRIMAFGQLESPWPVNGSVLVKDGLAFVAAGRSTHLDGGIRLVALDPQTGNLVAELKPTKSDAHGLADVLVSDGDLVYMRHLAYAVPGRTPPAKDGPRKQPRGGRRAFSTAGLLDDSYFSRVGWTIGGGGPQFDLLVFDDQFTYGFRSRRQGGYGGMFRPGTGAYRVACIPRGASKARWHVSPPIQVLAMFAAGEKLFLAGTPDRVDPADPWAAFEARSGGVIRAISLRDGHKLAGGKLAAAPVFDGMATAYGRLFLATVDGHILCLGKP